MGIICKFNQLGIGDSNVIEMCQKSGLKGRERRSQAGSKDFQQAPSHQPPLSLNGRTTIFYVSLLINEMPLLWRSSSNSKHHPANWKYKAIKKLVGSRIGGKCHNKQIPPPGIDLQPILICLACSSNQLNQSTKSETVMPLS